MSKILELIPIYIDGKGDCTEILIEDRGRVLIEKPISIVIDEILRERLICYGSLLRKTREITRINRNFPLYLTSGEMMIPMKIRKPKISGDKAYGLINRDYIDSVYKREVISRSGKAYKLLETEKAFHKRREMAESIQRSFEGDEVLSLIYDPKNNKDLNDFLEKIRMLFQIADKVKNL